MITINSVMIMATKKIFFDSFNFSDDYGDDDDDDGAEKEEEMENNDDDDVDRV